MKQYSSLLWGAMALMCLSACSSRIEEIHYEGPAFVQFSDTLYDMPVTQSELYFEVPLVVSQTSSADRNLIVDVDLKHTNAIEGYHFTLEERNVTVPAGERVAKVRLKGCYEHLNAADSLAVTLQVLNAADQPEIYPLSANVRLYKILPFCIDDYAGDMLLTCTFPYSTSSTSTYLTSSRKVNDSTLVLLSTFEDGRDLTLRFHTGFDNPFDRDIEMREQVAFVDQNYGTVCMCTNANYPSYYFPEERAFVLYLDAYLPLVGSFGTYYYIFQWITPDEAEARRNGLTTLY